MEVARLSDVLRRPADGVGTLQVEYARRLIEGRVGGRRPGCVGSGYQDMRPARERNLERTDCTRYRGRMAIREGARADGGWEEGARREGMGMASSQARVVLCRRARHTTRFLLVSIRQYQASALRPSPDGHPRSDSQL